MQRTLAWTNAAWADYLWCQGQDRKTLRRINRLITVDDARVTAISCRYHYER